MKIVIHADGACPNNGAGGAVMGLGVVAVAERVTREFQERREEAGATNNRAELLAIELALKKVRPEVRATCEVAIYSDSQWAVRALTGEYSVSANLDLIARIHALMEEFGVPPELRWVKGHSGDPLNERAHLLAETAAGMMPRGACPQ